MLDSDLLSPGRILAGVRVNSKKRLLELISVTLGKKNKALSSREIFDAAHIFHYASAVLNQVVLIQVISLTRETTDENSKWVKWDVLRLCCLRLVGVPVSITRRLAGLLGR